jgi:ABC-type uncharacterized transport system permease subunit
MNTHPLLLTVRALISVIDAADVSTRGRSLRISRYALRVAQEMGVPEAEWPTIELGALLHDLGRNAILTDVALQPRALNPAERELVRTHSTIGWELIKDIPGLGLVFRDLSPIIIVAFILVPVSAYVINRTVFGLRLRSVGENPLAADTLGINVYKMRYAAVLISGALAGMAGAFLAVEHTGVYLEGQTGGRGFIAMAAMIFGGWTPTGAMVASLLFGLAQAVTLRVKIPGIPYQFVQMLPYLLTIAVLAGFVRKAVGPAASGVPYEREGE